ncbi:hypothetical protein Tco_0812943, partial [Tanacetum coccineum]
TFEVLDELMEIIGSTKLHKRMRFWFVQDITKGEGLLKFLHDRYDDLRRKSVRRRLTDVMAEILAGIHEKEGHMARMDLND